jgi:hypothetical protein
MLIKREPFVFRELHFCISGIVEVRGYIPLSRRAWPNGQRYPTFR